ncbi:MAG: acetylglutamate kinase [Endomicrobia bacterium]|nr:acetylglutamate kinase [Endomicrobiia bacterium]
MRWLIKLSGKILDNKAELNKFLLQVIKVLQQDEVVVIHGGGIQISRWMQQLGLKPKFIDGLRVTDEKTLEVVTGILCGLINKQLVLNFVNLGIKNVVGISCLDSKLLLTTIDKRLGFVGKDVVYVDTELIDNLLRKGYLVLVATVGLGIKRKNSPLVMANINADTVVYALATSRLKFDKVVLVTDKPGVLNKNGELIKKLYIKDINKLIKEKVVTEGMIPKLNAVKKMFVSGVKKVVITNSLESEGTVLVDG